MARKLYEATRNNASNWMARVPGKHRIPYIGVATKNRLYFARLAAFRYAFCHRLSLNIM